MARTSSIEPAYGPAERTLLLGLAGDSIRHGLEAGAPLAVDPASYPPQLLEPGAAFVTLQLGGELRGCIGSLEAYRPLVVDVAHNAFNAAFRDPRFPPVGWEELPRLDLHLSILSPATPLDFASEAELLAQLRPGVDGLILQEGGRRGTFLPSVWEQLPEPHLFLAHLKLKAGLPERYWSPTVQVWRYTTESFA